MKIISTTVFLFLIICGSFFLCRSCRADTWIPYAEFNTNMLEHSVSDRFKKKSVDELRIEWIKEYEFHKTNAIRCYEDAKDRCWWLPEISDRDKARYCYTSAFAALGTSVPSTKLLLMVGSLLLQYGLDMQDEWNYIDNKMHWARYHFEMCDHYQKLLEGNR